MNNTTRLFFTMYYWLCNVWRRKVCVLLSILFLLSFSLFALNHSFHRENKKNQQLSDMEEDSSVEFTPSWLFSKPMPEQQYNGRLEKYVSSQPRDTSRRMSRGKNDLVPCSNLTNESHQGPIESDINTFPSMKELETNLSDLLQLGGHYVPTNCRPTQRIAVILPFRDREIHLRLFLRHMHPFLQRQKVEYYIVVVEQAEGDPFNRALLFNIGYYKTNKLHDIDCYIFHDVDLLPLDDRIMYLCQEQPLHLSMLVDTLGNKLMYEGLFGGVVALTPEMMQEVNGFSNLYYGWGGEDDDMSYRIRTHGYNIDRYSKEVSRYTMMKHGREEDVDQGKLDRKVEVGRERISEEGLNTLVFHLLEFQPLPLYTWILIRPNISTSLEEFRAKMDKDILS